MLGVQEHISGLINSKRMEEVAMPSSPHDASWVLWSTMVLVLLLGVLLSSSSFLTYLSSLRKQVSHTTKLGPTKPIPEVSWSLPLVGEGLRMCWQGLHWFLHDRSLRFSHIGSLDLIKLKLKELGGTL
jgi:hypothetical protein